MLSNNFYTGQVVSLASLLRLNYRRNKQGYASGVRFASPATPGYKFFYPIMRKNSAFLPLLPSSYRFTLFRNYRFLQKYNY
jgi:hypothetical protein